MSVESFDPMLLNAPRSMTPAVHNAELQLSFVAVVQSTNSPVITKALDGTITTWNPAAEQLYKYTAAEAIGASIDILVPPDRRNEHQDIIDKALAGQPIDDFETVRIDKDRRPIDVRISMSPIKSATGEIVGMFSITTDITARKIAEEKFRLVVESCPDGMVLADREGKMVLVNGEVERLFGYAREELIGQSVEILLPAGVRTRHQRQREGFARDNGAHRVRSGRELMGLHKDGTEFPVEVGLNPIRTREGLMVLAAVVDISERKRVERLKDEFVSTVSHELRTPLTSIAGSLGLLIANAAGKLPESAAHLLTIAYSNSKRLVRLINDILDIEKMEAGQLVFHLSHIEIRALLEQTIEANRAFAEGYGVRVRFDAASAGGEVFADSDRLSQIVTNLLSNAIKFSPPGDEVVVGVERNGCAFRISIRDHGPGIPEDFKPRVFAKFAQADASDARQKGGTGLGLNIVKQLVDQHGGKVGFEPAPGGGCIFFFELPCVQDLGTRTPEVQTNGMHTPEVQSPGAQGHAVADAGSAADAPDPLVMSDSDETAGARAHG